jgi:uncharacterized membrane protein
MVILRLAHIGSGVLWAGGAIFLTWFIEPTAAALGPKAGPFMGALTARKVGVYFSIVATLAVLAGTTMYWIDSNGDPIGFFTTSPFGLALGIGGILAWIAWVIGFTTVRTLTDRMGRASAQAATSDGPPPPEVLAEIQAVQARLHRAGLIDLWLILGAIVLMSTARYL